MKIEEAMAKVRTGRFTLTYDGKRAELATYSVGAMSNDLWGVWSRSMRFLDALTELRAAPGSLCMQRDLPDADVYVIREGIIRKLNGRRIQDAVLYAADLLEEDWILKETP